MQTDDCGYYAAVPVLLNAGAAMVQKTPPATAYSTKWRRSIADPPKSADAALPPLSKKRQRSDQEGHSDGSPGPDYCSDDHRPFKKARRFSDDGATIDRRWVVAQDTEQMSPFRVLPNYPDVINVLPPGARRRAVNTIHLMSNALNLEICTPGLGVLIMDRFFSSRKASPRCCSSVMLTAMICLNAAGKVADLDKGFCGSRGVMAMVRNATPPALRQPDHTTFARYAASIEREVLRSIENTLLSYPCALQIIATVTGWHENDESLWLRSAIVCDVFGTDSASTQYTQTQIAMAVVGILTNSPTMYIATVRIIQCIDMFVNSAKERVIWKDPYFGVRCRHAHNPEMPFFIANSEKIFLAYGGVPLRK